MKQFFKTFFASLLAMVVAGVILIFIFIAAIIGSISSGGGMFAEGGKEVKVKENSVLHIKLDKQIVDRATNSPFDFDPFSFSSTKALGLNQIMNALEKAKEDDRIEGVYLDLSNVAAGFATHKEIREALLDFKESGKWIIAYSEVYTQGAYYLASVADEIYLNPQGALDFRGLRSKLAFFKGALDKLEVEAQIIRGSNNKYKSAVEPFFRENMSDANREQMNELLEDIWTELTEAVSKSRNISTEDLNEIADSLLLKEAKDAVELGLVDKLAYKDEIIDILREKLELKEDDEEINYVDLRKYFKTKDPNKEKDKDKDDDSPKIAVIYAQGGIESGKGDHETIGSETVSKALRKAREDSTVKAIVFRVNSPGGSALASEVIWREVILAKEAKPVVVSMGDLAASGGYYVACGADKIFAGPSTITGSIGVFGMLPNMQGLFNNKLGITFDGVKTNQFADLADMDRPLNEEEMAFIQGSVDNIYDVFVSHVAEGRGMKKADVDSIARGRVWTGIDAKELGLVDELGGLNDAIDAAAELAELEEYDLKSFPEEKDPFEEIMIEFTGGVKNKILEAEMGKSYKYYKFIRDVEDWDGVQARLPFFMEIR